MRNQIRPLVALLFAFLLVGCSTVARDANARGAAASAHDIIGVEAEHLRADYWIGKQSDATGILLDAPAIAAQNARLREIDASVNDIERLPEALDRTRVHAWIETLSRVPDSPLYDFRGGKIPREVFRELRASLALEAIPLKQRTRYGLITHRADLRTFPTSMRVFNAPGDTEIDRFQENALFPGTPVAIVHSSLDGQWWFVVSDLYEAWVEQRFVAAGDAERVFAFGRRQPYLVVTGSDVRTMFTPDLSQVSELQLDMGVRIPFLADWPADRPVNGKLPDTAHVVELPVRGANGELAFSRALLARQADVASEYVPLSRAGLLQQSFKFLGERYGWGHSNNTRDCSGFVSEVYRSFGVTLPRNTGDQEASRAFKRIAFDEQMDHAERIGILRTLDVGDLVYIPGHVMMVIGHEQGLPYVIHDTREIGHQTERGTFKRVPINGVAVTPLAPLLSSESQFTVDRITSVQRILQ